jgi:hypothetical protein
MDKDIDVNKNENSDHDEFYKEDEVLLNICMSGRRCDAASAAPGVGERIIWDRL